MRWMRPVLHGIAVFVFSNLTHTALAAGGGGFLIQESSTDSHAVSVRTAAENALQQFIVTMNDQRSYGQSIDDRLEEKSSSAKKGQRQRSSTHLPAGFPLAVSHVEDLSQTHIGWGFVVNHADPERLLSGEGLAKSAQPEAAWRFAIMRDGNPIGLVTMAFTGERWEAVSFGAAALSREIDGIVKQYADSPDVTLRYIRVLQATSDFVEVTHAKQASPQYMPLAAARTHLELPSDQQQSEAQFLPKLRDAVQRGLQNID